MSKLLDKIKSTQEDLDKTVEIDRANLYNSIRTLEKRIMSDLAALESKDGKLVSPKVNLKQAQKIHSDMKKHFKDTYGTASYKVTNGYGKAAKRIKSLYKDLDVSVEFTGVDKDSIKELQKRSYDEYLAYGESAQQSISKAMYSSVLTKGFYKDLLGSVSAALTGHLSKSGKPMSSYANTWANDGLMNFHQTILTKKGNDAGLNTYLYVGNVMSTTRDFCVEHVMKVYTKKEIESWDYSWSGKSGPAMTNRGGWNCRHHWQPIKKAWVEDLEEDIVEDEEIQAELKVVKHIPKVTKVPPKSVRKPVSEADQMKSIELKIRSVRSELSDLMAKSKKSSEEMSKIMLGQKELASLTKQRETLLEKLKPTIAYKPDKKVDKEVWDKAETPEEAARQIKEKYGINDLTIRGYGNRRTVEIANSLGMHITQAVENNPGLKSIISKTKPLSKVTMYSESAWERRGKRSKVPDDYHRSVMGLYGSDFIKLNLRDGLGTGAGVLKGYNAGEGALSAFVHEWGHHFRKKGTIISAKVWEKFYKKKGSSYFKKNVSVYSATNASEAFSECFAIAISPNYGKGTVRLPKEIEEIFMKKLRGV